MKRKPTSNDKEKRGKNYIEVVCWRRVGIHLKCLMWRRHWDIKWDIQYGFKAMTKSVSLFRRVKNGLPTRFNPIIGASKIN